MEVISRTLLDFLLNSVWQIAMVAAAAVAAERLARRGPAHYRHWVWVMALALSVFLPIGTAVRAVFVAGSAPLPSRSDAAAISASLPEATPRNVTGTDDSLRLITRARAVRSHAFGLENYFHQRKRRVPLPPSLGVGIVVCYLLFVLYRLIRLGQAWKKTTEIRDSANAREIPDWIQAIVARCQAAVGLNLPGQIRQPGPRTLAVGAEAQGVVDASTISLLCSPKVTGPVALGGRRPVIVVPESFFSQVSAEDVTAALAHELAHIRRHDFALNLLYEIIYWPLSFHPAAKMIKRQIDETREIACDELASRCLMNSSDYARSLVNLARAMCTPSLMAQPGYSLGVFDANILEERVMRLLDNRPHLSARLAAICFFAGSLLLAATCMAAAAFSLSAGQEKKAESDDALKPFVGTWRGETQGKTFALLVLRSGGKELTGTISLGVVRMSDGEPAEVVQEPELPGVPVFDSRVQGNDLFFGSGGPRGRIDFRMKLMSGGRAEVAMVGISPQRPGAGLMAPFKVTRVLGVTIVPFSHNIWVTLPATDEGKPTTEEDFVGSWEGKFSGRRFVTVELKWDGERFAGTISPFNISLDKDGNLTRAEPRSHGGWRIAEAHHNGKMMLIEAQDKDSGDVNTFELVLVHRNEAHFAPWGRPTPIRAWIMRKLPRDPKNDVAP